MKKELESIQIHMDMLLTDRICEHAVISTKDHDMPFQIFRLLSGYEEALEQIDQFTKEKKEFIERYKDLLDESMNHYPYTPNAFRKTVEEYYQEEIKYLEGLKDV
jgi:hypothetical protein